MTQKSSILVIDDDPSHLKIYCMVIESAGLQALPALVSWSGIALPEDGPVDAVLLDYCLMGNILARDIAQQVKAQYPSAPVLLLSDLPALPSDIAPWVQGFVRKGNPEKLVSTLYDFVGRPAL